MKFLLCLLGRHLWVVYAVERDIKTYVFCIRCGKTR